MNDLCCSNDIVSNSIDNNIAVGQCRNEWISSFVNYSGNIISNDGWDVLLTQWQCDIFAICKNDLINGSIYGYINIVTFFNQ